MRNLYLDLDGVLAGFDAYFPALFGIDHRGMADDAMWRQITSHGTYFRDMPVCPGALDFYSDVRHLNPIILTACPKSDYARVAVQKREWCREHLSDDVTVLPVMGGRNKPLFMHREGDVLVDDFAHNCEAWVKAGGIAIEHNGDFERTLIEVRYRFDE